MAIVVYDTATGKLVSWIPGDVTVAQAQAINLANPMAGLAQPDVLASKGLTAVDGVSAPSPTNKWDPATKAMVAVAAPPATIASYQFILLFTAAETAAIRASTDPNVQHWLFALSVTPTIHLGDTTVVQPGLQYLVSQNFITSDRMAQIVANTPPRS